MASHLPPPDAPDSFQPAAAEPKPPADAPLGSQGTRRIEYLNAFRFAFSNPDWLKPALIGGILAFLPVIGPLLVLGYSYEIVELLHRHRVKVYPTFDLKRFGPYVQRGVWPFLIAFIANMILSPIFQIGIQVPTFGLIATFEADERAGAIAAAIVIPLVLITLFLVVLAAVLFLTPLMMRAGLSQDFVKAFNFQWIGDFIKRMWLETLLINIFLILSSLVFFALGCAVFCVGAFVTTFLTSIAASHLVWQLYELYLERGGEPIPLKPLPADVPPVAVPPPAGS